MRPKYWLALAAAASLVLGSTHLTRAQETPLVPPASGPLDPNGTPRTPGGAAPAITFSEVLFPHGLLGAALERHANKDGSIDYAGLKGSRQLQEYVDDVGRADRSKFPVVGLGIDPKYPKAPEKMDHSFEMAYLINAYNALMIQTLAERYPVNSPNDDKGFYTDKTHNVAGKMVSFQELRDEIQARDPRTFFALLTGTRGGPSLSMIEISKDGPAVFNPYTYSTVDKMLDIAASNYIDNPNHVQIQRIGGNLGGKVTIDEYMQGADPLFAQANVKGDKPDRKQWAGVKRALQVYSKVGSNKRYFNAGEYRIEWAKTNTGLNYQNSGFSAPVGSIGSVNPAAG